MTFLTIKEARAGLSEAINRVAYAGERVVIGRRGSKVAALVSMDDLRLLEQLEERMDIEDARRALAEPGGESWEEIKARLGL